MDKIGRNEKCTCGSGKKYKTCCMPKFNNVSIDEWKANADIILNSMEEKEKIKIIYFELLNIIKETNWQGSCHAVSTVMHILFKEIGLDSTLCIGQLEYKNSIFDHSWVEIDNKVFDISIYRGINNISVNTPIINGCNIDTKNKDTTKYGLGKMYNIDRDTKAVLNLPIIKYIDGFPFNMIIDKKFIKEIKNSCELNLNGLWIFIVGIGKLLGLNMELNELKEKYKDCKRVQK